MKKIFYCLSLPFLFLLMTGCQKEAATIIENSYITPEVDAGNAVTVQLPSSGVTLSGTVIKSNGPIRGYLWSLVGGPNIPNIHTPSMIATTISGLVQGTYRFQFVAIDSAGFSGVDTVTVSVIAPLQQTLTLQPANNPNEVVFAIIVGGNDVSAHDIDLNACAWTNGGLPLLARGGVKFDLSSIPATATIVSAKLSLYSNPTPINGNLTHANSGTNNAFYVRRITGNWNPLSATWATQPATDAAGQVSVPHTAQTFFDVQDIDVTGQVAQMVSGTNYGFMIQLQNEVAYNIRQFASSRHTNATKHPKLVVVYQ